MRKRWFLVGMIFLLVPWLLVGCGIAQEQYDAVVADLGRAQQEVQTVQSELAAAQAKASELTSSLGKTETELEATEAKNSELASSLEKTQTELEATQTDLEATQAKNSELTSSLEKSRSELSSVASEFESFRSEASMLWSSLKPIVELHIYWDENMVSWGRYNIKEITSDQLNEQTGDQWGRITVALKAIDNDEFSDSFKAWWFASGTTKNEHRVTAFDLLVTLTEQATESMSKLLSK